MSEQQLTREEKITAILEFNGVHENHHDHLREHLDLLTDNIIDRQYAHCLLIQACQSVDYDPDTTDLILQSIYQDEDSDVV